MDLILAAVMIASVQATSYRSVPEATDSSPFITSIGERTNHAVVAVSQDFLASGQLRYGDTIYIEGVGVRKVFDCMNKRHKQRIDVWAATWDEEHQFHKRFKNRKVRIYKILLPEEVHEAHKKGKTHKRAKR